MDINYIREFVSLAETGSFTKASHRLFLSQPTLSKHMKVLENSLGVLLFARDWSGVRLTVHGRRFLPYARQMVRLQDEASRELLPEDDRRRAGERSYRAEESRQREAGRGKVETEEGRPDTDAGSGASRSGEASGLSKQKKAPAGWAEAGQPVGRELNLAYLAEFIAAAESCNLTETSEYLFVSQSTLSRHIKSLEETLGVCLFERGAGRIRLNRCGEIVRSYAERMVHMEEECRRRLKKEGVEYIWNKEGYAPGKSAEI